MAGLEGTDSCYPSYKWAIKTYVSKGKLGGESRYGFMLILHIAGKPIVLNHRIMVNQATLEGFLVPLLAI